MKHLLSDSVKSGKSLVMMETKSLNGISVEVFPACQKIKQRLLDKQSGSNVTYKISNLSLEGAEGVHEYLFSSNIMLLLPADQSVNFQ